MEPPLFNAESFVILAVTAACLLLIYWLAQRQAEARRKRLPALRGADLAAMNPIAFEHHCAAVLKAQGWMCKMTAVSGDFGVDVVAERQGVRVALQMKKWKAPVDLGAVQEVTAGMPVYRAHAAAIVSVSGYRPSAQKLAAANKVMLLAYEDLFDFKPAVRAARP